MEYTREELAHIVPPDRAGAATASGHAGECRISRALYVRGKTSVLWLHPEDGVWQATRVLYEKRHTGIEDQLELGCFHVDIPSRIP